VFSTKIEVIKQKRSDIGQAYQQKLSGLVQFQRWNPHSQNNHAYAPVLFESEEILLEVEVLFKGA